MRYFFNLAGAVHDPENLGLELPDLAAAREQAVKAAAEYLRDRPETVWMGDELRKEVTTANGLILFTFIALAVDAPVLSGKAS